MSAIETLQRAVEHSLPSAWSRVRRPRDPQGMWWLDIKYEEHLVTVQWSPTKGFGVSASALPDGFGEGPEETFGEPDEATARVLTLLQTKSHTVPPQDVFLRELRALVGLTQQQVATILGVQQAAVSRLERRPDITLSSLRRYVAALGAELEISVRMSAGTTVRLSEPETATRQNAACRHVEDRLPVTDAAAIGLPFGDCESWLQTFDTLARTKWSLSWPKLALRADQSGPLANADRAQGVVSVDAMKAWRLTCAAAKSIAGGPCSSPTDEGSFHSTLRHLLAHEVGHVVDGFGASSREAFGRFAHAELRADAVAGWLAGHQGDDWRPGAEISSLLGCRVEGCTHPTSEERAFAYLVGHVEGMRDRFESPAVNLLVIRSADLERSRQFYSCLGLDLRPERHGRGPRHYACTLDGTVFELYPRTGDAPNTGDTRIGLRVQVTSKTIEQLRAHGLLGDEPKMVKRPGGTNICALKDPDGNTVELDFCM